MHIERVFALLLAGVVIGGGGSELVGHLLVPPARAGTNPSHWEQRCFTADELGIKDRRAEGDLMGKVNGWNSGLAKLSAEGWDVVQYLSDNVGRTFEVVAVCAHRPI